jgi:serine/threonine protein kinase
MLLNPFASWMHFTPSNPFHAVSKSIAEIVHRDLNLENILLEENKELDQMKIIDFGLATKYEDGVKLTELVGKGNCFFATIVCCWCWV